MPPSLNHGVCAGALAWVRSQMLSPPASAFNRSIASRAAEGSAGPACANSRVATDMSSSPPIGLLSLRKVRLAAARDDQFDGFTVETAKDRSAELMSVKRD